MKPLAIRNIELLPVDEDNASLIMSTIPLVMDVFRSEMRANRPAGLSVPQFRSLIFIEKQAEPSISGLAEHMGLAISTASKLVDGLVKNQYVERASASDDRRRVVLTLTNSGRTALEDSRAQAHARIRQHLSGLALDEEESIEIAMRALHRIFGPGL